VWRQTDAKAECSYDVKKNGYGTVRRTVPCTWYRVQNGHFDVSVLLDGHPSSVCAVVDEKSRGNL
jgi:hypothetical protein